LRSKEKDTMDERDVQEERTEQLIQVRRVTDLHAAWTEEERGAPGAFTLQLILDHGADEYILRPTAEDADVLLGCGHAARAPRSIWSARCSC
jgi:hypothetical protein